MEIFHFENDFKYINLRTWKSCTDILFGFTARMLLNPTRDYTYL